jgi:hypothetical protein
MRLFLGLCHGRRIDGIGLGRSANRAKASGQSKKRCEHLTGNGQSESFMHNTAMIRALGAIAFLCLLAMSANSPARADGSVSQIGMGMGAKPGEMPKFDAVVAQYNASGERFRIDSHCQSACTIFLSIKNVCVTPGATLLFHSGGDPKANRPSAASTQHMLSAYNAALREYVTANHYMDTFTLHPISGSEIISKFGYPACK